MGCFCRNLIPRPQQDRGENQEQNQEERADDQPDPLVPAVAQWLASRWLPSEPWEPDPAWLEQEELPAPPMPPAALSVLTSLFVAEDLCKTVLRLDPVVPDEARQLARVVSTLNARTEQLQELAEEERPWTELLQLATQADLIQAASRADVFRPAQPDEHDVRSEPWRTLLRQVKALVPLVAIGQLAKLDWRDPATPATLAKRVKPLARIELPPLADQMLVLRLLGELDAVARLKDSLGADPSGQPYSRVRNAVERRVRQALSQLPPDVRVVDGVLAGMPDRPPNPAQLLNDATVKQARRMDREVVARLDWQIPAFGELPLLTAALPVAQLASTMAKLAENPVRQSPCDTCDAARVMRAAPDGAAAGRPATARPGSGTGAAPAG